MTMIGEGTYLGTVVGMIVAETKDQQPQMAIDVTISKVADGSNWIDIPPEQRTMYWSFSDGAMPYTTKKLQALEFNGNFDAPDCGEKAKTQGVVLICKHEMYEGKQREKWELANWGSNAQPAGASALAIAKAKWRAACGTAARPAAAASKPAPKPAPASAPKPPAPKAPPAKAADGMTREQAWEVVVGVHEDQDRATKAWASAISEYEKQTGKDEGEFEPGDWAKIADRAKLPF